MKWKVTLASNAEGWDKMVNGQLETELARCDRVEVSGFVPGYSQKQRDHARALNIKLYDAKVLHGFPKTELLSYPPDDLEIDILIMHSYGRDVGRQAQIITEAKNCKLVLVVHTISEDLEKFTERPASSTVEQESEQHLQVTLSEQADLVIAVGPKVAEAYKAALRFCEKQERVLTLMPNISEELLGVCQLSDNPGTENSDQKFRVLISASSKYFKVKGCDIAAKAIQLLDDPLYHLILVVQPSDDTVEISKAMSNEGINLNQLTVKKWSEDPAKWGRWLCEVDLVVKPSRTEGFGMSGLRAISADLPVLISGNCGLGIALKKLPSGAKHVVNSDDPQAWAGKIREVKAKHPQTRHSQAKQLRNEYTEHFKWNDQFDVLIEEFFKMVPPEARRRAGGRHGSATGSDNVDGRPDVDELKPSVQETNQGNKDDSWCKMLDSNVLSTPRLLDSLAARQMASVSTLPMSVYKQVCEMLNIRQDERFNDFRMLAEKTGLSVEETRELENSGNPTDHILVKWSNTQDVTVQNLIDILLGEDLERRDVAGILQDWVNQRLH